MHNHKPSLKSFRMTKNSSEKIEEINKYTKLSKTIIIRAAFNLGFKELNGYKSDLSIRMAAFHSDSTAKVGDVSNLRITKIQEQATLNSRTYRAIGYSASCRLFIWFGFLNLLHNKINVLSKEDFINYVLTNSFREVK